MATLHADGSRQDLLEWISEEYRSMNGTSYETFHVPPSALEFSRMWHISRPVLIKGCTIGNVRSWSDEYLSEHMGDRPISVAVTPNGYADAVTTGPDGKLYFAEPHVENTTMKSFLSKLTSPRKMDVSSLPLSSEPRAFCRRIRRILGSVLPTITERQLFDSGFFDAQESPSEFESLRRDVPAEIDWCSEAFGRHPDAVNLWIGNSRSVTSIHSDPYENIDHVVRGCKHFILLPPTEGWCLKERLYPHAVYTRDTPASPLTLTPSPPTTAPVRWSSIRHPELPGHLPPSAQPIHISVHAGETLYLPAGWWHHVRQSQDTTIALNWSYDIESRGMSWVWLNFLRGVGDVPDATESEDTKLN